MKKKEKNFKLYDVIKADLLRLPGVTQPCMMDFIKWYFVPKGHTFPHTVWFRILMWVKKKNYYIKCTIGIIHYLIDRHFTYKYGIHTNANINVGKGLWIVHGDGVYLNCKSIGENFTVYQNVTIGNLKGGIPVIGDNVTIYPGAVVVGNIVLNNGCTIGANSYIDKDVPSGAVVVGNPAHQIK